MIKYFTLIIIFFTADISCINKTYLAKSNSNANIFFSSIKVIKLNFINEIVIMESLNSHFLDNDEIEWVKDQFSELKKCKLSQKYQDSINIINKHFFTQYQKSTEYKFISDSISNYYFSQNSLLLNKLEHKWNLDCIDCDLAKIHLELESSAEYINDINVMNKSQLQVIRISYPIFVCNDYYLVPFSYSKFRVNEHIGVLLFKYVNYEWKIINKYYLSIL